MSIEWYELDGDMGPGALPSGTATEGWMTGIESRLSGLEALPTPPDTTTDLTDWSTTAPSEGQFAVYTAGKWTPTTRPPITVPFSIPFIVSGGSGQPSTGVKGIVRLPFAATVLGWTVNNDVSGNVVWDVHVGGTTIFTTKPQTISAISSSSGTLNIPIAANSALEFWIDSVSTVTLSSLNLTLTRSLAWGS